MDVTVAPVAARPAAPRVGRLLVGRRLTGRLDGDAITGTVAVAGHPGWSFTVRPATGLAANTEDSLVSGGSGNS